MHIYSLTVRGSVQSSLASTTADYLCDGCYMEKGKKQKTNKRNKSSVNEMHTLGTDVLGRRPVKSPESSEMPRLVVGYQDWNHCHINLLKRFL